MKKKFSNILLLLLSISLLTALSAFPSSAKSTVKKSGFVFSVGSKYASVVEYTGKASTVKIPETVNGKKVTAINKYAFWQNKTMTAIEIPSTVKTVGEAAFNECTALTEVSFPNGVETVGNAAFWYCTALKTVVLPESVKSLGKNVFTGCSSLTVYVKPNTEAEKYVKSLADIKLGYISIDSLSASGFTLNVGSSKTAEVKISPETVLNSKLKFSSGDKKVATVTSKGKVKAVSCGKAVITCKTTDGSSKSVKFTVKVVPPLVTSFKQSVAKSTYVKLSWDELKDVDGYQLSKYNESTKKWESLATTSKTTYKISGLKLGASVKVKIRSYKKIDKTTYYSAYIKSITATTLKPDTVKNVSCVSSTADSIKLTWDKLPAVSGYNVYIIDKATANYKLLASTSSTSYTAKKLAANTEYIFAVKSYIKSGDSVIETKEYSEPSKYATCPSATVLQNDESGQFSTRLAVKWGAIKDISGYELDYKKSSDTNWTTLKLDPSQTSHSFDSLLPLTEYQFRSRAYTDRTYKLFYGAYSAVVKVSTNDLPSDNTEAFNIFMKGFKALKNDTTSSILLFTDMNVKSRTVTPENEQCHSILDALPMYYNKQYNIENGQILGKDSTITSLIAPEVKDITVEQSDVDVTFNYDGSGFRIKLTLPEENEKAPLASSFAPLPNWTRAGNGKSFELSSVKYPKTVIEAKIQNGIICDIVVSMPINAEIKIGSTDYKLSETINYNYIVTYFD